MDKGLKAKWLDALRSGRYTQDVGQLRSNFGYCCLGVLLDLSGLGRWDDYGNYEIDCGSGETHTCEGDLGLARNEFGIPHEAEIRLVNMNDGRKRDQIRQHSFAEIADYIEANL